MPIGQQQPPVLGDSTASFAYWKSFREKAFTLITWGVQQLDTGQLRDAEEPDISGELARVIDTILNNPESPNWVTRLSVYDDPPIHDAARLGKRRRRLDLRIDDSSTRPRQNYAFEAKRLGSNNGVRSYLGSDGLMQFINGHYSPEASEAGMLGYVQRHTPAVWADKISAQVSKKASDLQCDGAWHVEHTVKDLDSYRTQHQRPSLGKPITIYHLLLDFSK